MEKPVYIIAESYWQAERFAKDNMFKIRQDWVYVPEPNRLNGLREATIKILGFPKNSDIDEWERNIYWARYEHQTNS